VEKDSASSRSIPVALAPKIIQHSGGVAMTAQDAVTKRNVMESLQWRSFMQTFCFKHDTTPAKNNLCSPHEGKRHFGAGCFFFIHVYLQASETCELTPVSEETLLDQRIRDARAHGIQVDRVHGRFLHLWSGLSLKQRHRNTDSKIGPGGYDNQPEPKENDQSTENQQKLKDLAPIWETPVAEPLRSSFQLVFDC
jgi:hypothetical protein